MQLKQNKLHFFVHNNKKSLNTAKTFGNLLTKIKYNDIINFIRINLKEIRK